MNFKQYILVLLIFPFLGCKAQPTKVLYESETLKVEQLTQNTFRHISYLSTEAFGKVGCNGMVVMDNGEALIFDTPLSSSNSLPV